MCKKDNMEKCSQNQIQKSTQLATKKSDKELSVNAKDAIKAFFESDITSNPLYYIALRMSYIYMENDNLIFLLENQLSLNFMKKNNEFIDFCAEFFKQYNLKPTFELYANLDNLSKTDSNISFLYIPEIREVHKLPINSKKEDQNNKKNALKIADEKENIAEEKSLSLWCEYPTEITRISPFFPINRNSSANKEYIENLVISAGGWGKINYSGPVLTTDDETVLLSILAALDKNSSNRLEVKSEEGETQTYKYSGPMTPLFKYMGYNLKNISYKNRQSYMKSLKKLLSAVFTIDTKDKTIQISNILTAVEYNKQKRTLIVVINPFFYENFCNGTTTLLDVVKRSELSGSITKSLYRFIQSHKQRENKPLFKGHYCTVASSINMNTDGDHKEVKKNMRSAIAELIKHNILTKESSLEQNGILILYRARNTFPKLEK